MTVLRLLLGKNFNSIEIIDDPFDNEVLKGCPSHCTVKYDVDPEG